jgi:hypothetical protein
VQRTRGERIADRAQNAGIDDILGGLDGDKARIQAIARGKSVIECVYLIVCIFEHVQWRWALNDRLAPRLIHQAMAAASGSGQRAANKAAAGAAMGRAVIFLAGRSFC